MLHKTISRLVEKANRLYEASVAYNEEHPKGYPDYAYVAQNRKGSSVWAVTIMDGEYTLLRYDMVICVVDNARIERTGTRTKSDEKGIDGFLEALGVPNDNPNA